MIKKITVVTEMRTSGEIIPKEILWEDGRKFQIEKVTDIRKVASTKGGGSGIRYTCLILGTQKYLFLDENIWFVEN